MDKIQDNEKMVFSVVDYEKPLKPSYEETISTSSAIVNYGEDNKLPQFLHDCYLNSSTLKTIIDRAVDYSIGEGLEIATTLAKWKEVVNKKGETLEEVVKQLFYDYWTYGGFAIQVVYSKLNTIAAVYALDFAKCRTNERHDKIIYNRKWGKYSQKGVEYPAFDKTKFKDGEYSQILYFNGGARTVYPLPTYFGAINDILVDIKSGEYGINSMNNGFACRYIIEFLGGEGLPNEQKKAIEKGIKEKFTGSDSQNFMLYWGNSDTESLKISKIENDTDTVERYNAIRSAAKSNIFAAFGASPLLFGLSEGVNTGFSVDEFSNSFKLFNKTVIYPAQKAMEKVLYRLFDGDIKIKPFKIDFENEE